MSRNFGNHFSKQWPDDPPNNIPEFSQYGKRLLEQCESIEKPIPLNITNLLNNSNQFPIKFPIDSCRMKGQPSNRYELIEKQAASGYPIIHERTLWLYTQYLEYMHEESVTESEQRVYKQNKLSITEFIDRLLTKRCVSFYGKNDRYCLLSGEHGYSCYKELESSVTTNEINQYHPKSLDNLISYNEIKLSALLSVSSGTEFINDGTRKNKGIVEINKNRIEQSGFIIGIIGARLSKPNFMEFQDIIISKEQNTIDNGYGGDGPKYENTTMTNAKKIPEKLLVTNRLSRYRKMWNTFYGDSDTLYNECQKNHQRFDNCKNKNYIFDNLIMKKRYTISFDTLLLDAEARAVMQPGKRAYIHVVGIGLGVWQYTDHQEEIFLQTFEQRIKQLSDKLKHIGWIHFSWFNTVKCGDLYHNNIIGDTNIKILISKRNPAEKLIGDEFKNAFLLVSYAWDGNALPGNEFWEGKIASTGDSAAAASSLITELHNPHINKTMISGNNLHIASTQFGVLHLSDYVKKIL